MLRRRQIADAKTLDQAIQRCAFEAPTQALAQGGEMVAAEQASKTFFGSVGHAGANLRSGSASRTLAFPSHVQRETNTASMPSCRCNWQIDTAGSSA